MKSSIPFITSPAWKCFSTEKNPGKLGVYYWFTFNREKKEIQLCSSVSFKSKELWDYLSESGIRCGVINMPLTYPPKELNGVMISGIHAHDDSEYTYPKQLKKQLQDKYQYHIVPSHHYLEKEEIVEEIKDIFTKRFDVAIDLFKGEKLSFLHLTLFVIDGMQHYYWDKPTDTAHENILLDLWKHIDRGIGRLLLEVEQEAQPDFNLFIISDHGEFLGEKQRFGHPCDCSDPIVRKVPWFNLTSVKRHLGPKQVLRYKIAGLKDLKDWKKTYESIEVQFS